MTSVVIEVFRASTRDPRTGDLRYRRVIGFSSAQVRSTWSIAVVEAVREKHPRAFKR